MKILQYDNLELPLLKDKAYNKNIAIYGCHGTNGYLAIILTRLGFSNFTLIDSELVEQSDMSNSVYTTLDLHTNRAVALESKLHDINPLIKTEIEKTVITRLQCMRLFKEAFIIINAYNDEDNRDMIRDYGKLEHVPNINVDSHPTSVLHNLGNALSETYRVYKIFDTLICI